MSETPSWVHVTDLRCSCGEPWTMRWRRHREDNDRVNLWSKEYGFLEVLVQWCPRCDPHVAEVTNPCT